MYRHIGEKCGLASPGTAGGNWLQRHAAEGERGLGDRSRRPVSSPGQTPKAMEEAVVSLRDAHPAWGGRKLRARLERLGHHEVPTPSTITGILRRHRRLDPRQSDKHTAWQRFEHPVPNDLWQMDFKGHIALQHGSLSSPDGAR